MTEILIFPGSLKLEKQAGDLRNISRDRTKKIHFCCKADLYIDVLEKAGDAADPKVR